MTRLRADLLLLTVALIWGLAFVFQKTAMQHIGPFTFLAARALLAALVLGILAIREPRHPEIQRSRAPSDVSLWPAATLAGLAFFIAAILQQAGIITATVTNAGFLTGLYVVITPLLMWIVFAKLPPAHVWPAIALAFAGTWLLGGGTIAGFSNGDWLIALSAVFWACHILIVSRAARLERPITFTAIQFAVVAFVAGIGAALLEKTAPTALLAALPEIAYVGLLSSALTFTVLAVALRHTPAVEASILVSLETAFAALAGALLLGESLGLIAWIGAVMMLTATLIVQIGPSLRMRRSPPV